MCRLYRLATKGQLGNLRRVRRSKPAFPAAKPQRAVTGDLNRFSEKGER
jgi:hypothetical protein